MPKMKKSAALLSLGLLALVPVLAGATGAAGASTVQVGPVVSASGDKLTNNEITISFNPRNTANVVTGWNDWNLNEGCGTSYSMDAGATWSRNSFIPGITRYDNNGNTYAGNGAYDFAGDPAVTFGPDGSAYFACYGYLYGTAAAPGGGVALFVSRSDDGGKTWGKPVQLATSPGNITGVGQGKGSNGQFPDHEAIAADLNPSSPYYGSVYVAQAQFHGSGPSPITFFYSRDRGQHWSSAVTVTNQDNNNSQDAIPSVGPDGSVYVTFDSNTNKGTEQVNIARSTNGGQTFGTNYVVTTLVNPVLDDLPNSDYREASYPASSVDGQNRVTVAWNDRRSGHSNMWYSRANGTDLSKWTAPAQIKASNKEQFFPWVHSTQSGRVDVVYYDRSRDPNNTLNYVTYSQLVPTSSTGLGVSVKSYGDWSPAFDGNAATGQTTTSCGAFIGDYIGVASDNTHVYLGWTGNGPHWHYNEFGQPVSCDVNQDTLVTSIKP